jgi:hypothetical protein
VALDQHYLKFADGLTELRRSDDGTLVAVWNRELTASEVAAIYSDEYMTFMLNPLAESQQK